MPNIDEPVTTMSTEECWALLEEGRFGRLAYRLVDELHLVPINYTLDGRALLFRTAEGSKLLAAALQSDVAFGIDWHDDNAAWSVVARGHLRRLTEDEEDRVDRVVPRSWVPTDKSNIIELEPTTVTGRWFFLQHAELGQQLLER